MHLNFLYNSDNINFLPFYSYGEVKENITKFHSFFFYNVIINWVEGSGRTKYSISTGFPSPALTLWMLWQVGSETECHVRYWQCLPGPSVPTTWTGGDDVSALLSPPNSHQLLLSARLDWGHSSTPRGYWSQRPPPHSPPVMMEMYTPDTVHSVTTTTLTLLTLLTSITLVSWALHIFTYTSRI